MSDEIRKEGLGVAPGVLDTIVQIAATEVEGVAAVGAAGLAGLVQKGARKGSARSVSVVVDSDDAVSVTVHLQVYYGNKLREVAGAVQTAVSEALSSQVGVVVTSVDVYVDGLVFAE